MASAFRSSFRPVSTLRSGLLRAHAPRRLATSASSSSSAAAGPESQQAAQSWMNRMWNSPVGFKTVHFWAPVMKWAIVLAGVSDFARPAEKLSLTQNVALTATGLIWTRWCLIIKPRNILLAAVNFFLGIVGIAQVSRIAVYRQSIKHREEKAGPAAAAVVAAE